MRRSLGKGLAQLMGEQADWSPSEAPIDSIVPNSRQPRQKFADQSIEELADSIRAVGIMQPLLVRPIAEGKYELIAGERRLRAARVAGLESVPILMRHAGAQDSLELALIENIQREDIPPLDCAMAYQRLADEFGLTQEQIAERVGKSRPAVANSIRLLRLPEEVQAGLSEGLITEGHAKVLLMADGPRAQISIYDEILKRGLSVREAEQLLKSKSQKHAEKLKASRTAQSTKTPEMAALEDALSVYFGAPVKIDSKRSSGSIQVDFFSSEDLQRILDILGITL